MKKSVRLLFLFVALGFAVVSCDGGDDITGGGDIGGGTGGGGTGGGGDNTGSLGKLEDTEFVKGGNEIVGVDGAIDNATSMMDFGEYPIWVYSSDIGEKSFIVKNNSTKELEVKFPNVLTYNSDFRLSCFDVDDKCIHITGTNSVSVKPNVEVEIKVRGTIEDKDRIVGNKNEKMLFLLDGKQVATIDLKYTIQPLAENYLDLSVASTNIDFGNVPLDTKVTKYIEFNDKGDVRDMVFGYDVTTVRRLAGSIGIMSDGNITSAELSFYASNPAKIASIEYRTGQKSWQTLDRNTGSPFYLYGIYNVDDDFQTVAGCNIYKEKKCLVPVVFYPAKTGEAVGNMVIDVKVKTPSNHPDGYEVEYKKSFTINFKGNGVQQ